MVHDLVTGQKFKQSRSPWDEQTVEAVRTELIRGEGGTLIELVCFLVTSRSIKVGAACYQHLTMQYQ